jgi:hypothetical protein
MKATAPSGISKTAFKIAWYHDPEDCNINCKDRVKKNCQG